jgi:hypothetical protein
MRSYHPDGVAPTEPGVVFVFGSNLSGLHGGGAAREAFEHFGAVWGLPGAIGRHGNSYAIPTKDYGIRDSLPLHGVETNIANFIAYAKLHPDTKFFVSRIGCGLAGFRDEQIAPLFVSAPENCSFAKQWKPYLESV